MTYISDNNFAKAVRFINEKNGLKINNAIPAFVVHANFSDPFKETNLLIHVPF